ncbi:hypothetical protein KIK06_03945 [Nocardiopsis sp. EMB25]|uniref:hypothetical protein n=1 Tax=Nocardiopsis sp. EMB25 TaxID=2835867 RepID=UPI002283C871|nr:hypothetical protein [Nocardiopsis sp. EMB25]MCY9783040.1 hypothetical protein [Nocardiopsis sp. EMB25]
MVNPDPRARLVRTLLDADSSASAEELTRVLVRELLSFGSETPSNLACAAHVEYGSRFTPPGPGRRPVSGLRIRGTDVPLGDVAWEIESTPLPRERFPGLTVEQWEAATRAITLLVLALEREEEPTP